MNFIQFLSFPLLFSNEKDNLKYLLIDKLIKVRRIVCCDTYSFYCFCRDVSIRYSIFLGFSHM